MTDAMTNEQCTFQPGDRVHPDLRPIVELDRNSSGRPFVGLTEFDPATGLAVRSAVLSSSGPHVADQVMRRRFDDMVRLMGDNVRPVIAEAFTIHDTTPTEGI